MEDEHIPNQAINDWAPMTDPVDLAYLGKLGEELGECLSAICRCVIQGIDEREPTTQKVNRHWLEDEVADVRAMLFHVEQHFELDGARLMFRQHRKYDFKAKWFAHLKAHREFVRNLDNK